MHDPERYFAWLSKNTGSGQTKKEDEKGIKRRLRKKKIREKITGATASDTMMRWHRWQRACRADAVAKKKKRAPSTAVD